MLLFIGTIAVKFSFKVSLAAGGAAAWGNLG
jgi:hypothetical protein